MRYPGPDSEGDFWLRVAFLVALAACVLTWSLLEAFFGVSS